MPTTPVFQIAIDSADPHLLARFWSAAVNYELEDHHEMITQLLEAGQAEKHDTVEIDGRLAWATAAAAMDPSGGGPRLLFQRVPESKTVKNRVHLDLHYRFDDEQRAAEVERLIGLGATKLWDGHQGLSTWVTMADPEGNEFCVA